MFADPPADTPSEHLLAPELRPATASFEAFYQGSYRSAVGLGFLLTRSHDAAQDLAQDALMAMHERWTRIENPHGYLRRALVNNSMRWRRRRKREEPAGPAPPHERSLTNEVDELWDALGRLPAKQRVAITLRYYEDLPYREIAELMGIPEGTVASAIRRGLDALRRDVRL